MTTKPYVSGTPYVDRMSDYCADCTFDPKKDCPVSHLYWAFLDRHRDRLDGNQRLAMPLRSSDKRSEAKKHEDHRVFEIVRARLDAGTVVTPDDVRHARSGKAVRT